MNRITIEQFRARLATGTETGALTRLYRALARRPDPLRALTARGEWALWSGAATPAAEAR